MNPDRQPQHLLVDRVEWIPSSPDEIEVRVYGTWHGSTVPPEVVLVVAGGAFLPLPDPPPPGLAPAWTAAFLAPVNARQAIEAGEARLAAPDLEVPLPPAEPGAMDGPPGTVVDPTVLAERRARRAELAEESAARLASSLEQTVETLRAQLAHLEERATRAGADRDRVAARVADAERRLRLAEQREEAERRRRDELEEEIAATRRASEAELEDLRARLAGAEDLVAALEKELEHVRRRAERAEALLAETARDLEDLEALRDRAAQVDFLHDQTEALRAEADALRAEAETLRDDADVFREEATTLRGRAAAAEARAAEADSLRAEADSARAEADSLRAEAATLRAEADALRSRAAVADARAAEADSLRAEADTLRAEVEAVRAEADALRSRAADADARASAAESRAAHADTFRAEADALRAEVEALRAEADILRSRAADAEARAAGTVPGGVPAGEVERLERRLAEERAAREAAERRLAAAPPVAAASDRERALAAQVAALESELTRRAAVHERVQEAIALIRVELAQVRSQVEGAQPARAAETAAVADLRAELVELEERAHALDAALRARSVDLEAARHELDRARADAAAARAEAERERQALTAAERRAAELLERLAEEQAARAAAESRAREGTTDPVLDPAAPTTGDPALDTLIAGLRAQVAAAREQLTKWGAPEGEEEARPEPDLPALDAPLPPKEGAEAEPRARPLGATEGAETEAELFGRREEGAGGGGGARLEHGGGEPAGGEAAVVRGGEAEGDDDTRRRLQAIAAELRAAVPGEAERGGGDVIGDLQRAAERLRTAAEQELERLERAGGGEEAAPAGDPLVGGEQVARGGEQAGRGGEQAGRAGEQAGRAGEPPAQSGEREAREVHGAPLGARRVQHGVAEAPWLRDGLVRLSHRDPDTAARLLAALLPVQALVVDDLAYDLTSPSAGTLRVELGGGIAHVVPLAVPGDRHEVDVVVEGPLEALAPLAAGGAPRRLKGVRVHGSRRALRRLVKARRAPVTLSDLGRAGSPVHPGLLLSALAAAVEPAWTRGHRFEVVYDIEGDGISTVTAADGAPLTVHHDDASDAAAHVTIGAAAFMPIVAGQAAPAGERATVAGERFVVDTLHAWFDAARGVAVRW